MSWPLRYEPVCVDLGCASRSEDAFMGSVSDESLDGLGAARTPTSADTGDIETRMRRQVAVTTPALDVRRCIVQVSRFGVCRYQCSFAESRRVFSLPSCPRQEFVSSEMVKKVRRSGKRNARRRRALGHVWQNLFLRGWLSRLHRRLLDPRRRASRRLAHPEQHNGPLPAVSHRLLLELRDEIHVDALILEILTGKRD